MLTQAVEQFQGFRGFLFREQVDLQIQVAAHISEPRRTVLTHQNKQRKEDGLKRYHEREETETGTGSKCRESTYQPQIRTEIQLPNHRACAVMNDILPACRSDNSPHSAQPVIVIAETPSFNRRHIFWHVG